MERNGHYWTTQDKQAIAAAQSFGELSHTALAVIGRMPQPIGQVCGPISTGGAGSIEENLAIFDATITQLINQRKNVFDQVPFEEHIFRIIDGKRSSRQNNQLLEEFYRPIFESGMISRLYFIHGWESSQGAQWEHALGMERGMDIVYLEQAFLTQATRP